MDDNLLSEQMYSLLYGKPRLHFFTYSEKDQLFLFKITVAGYWFNEKVNLTTWL